MESYRELVAQRAALDEKIDEARARELPAVIEDIRRSAAEYRLSEVDLWPKRKRKRRTPSEMAAARAQAPG